ncbi:MAG: hypothetical protein IAE77_09265 [Prosthecobacter sp.]|jgi:hypothetical protein|uniref:hypothetical protein n=1 Tax=Prosthecobacter sp. TaxID=1965333 RepID=UPI0019DC74A5|nr:hypothetical protein [Prosthecobacter sp.]MBE2283629.1 hypothetical protein [Prosthecobacter sp.]
MRGFPPIQLALLIIAFIVLAIPLSHLTGNAQDKPLAKAGTKEEKHVKALVRLRYAHKPATLSLKIGDQSLVTAADESPIEVDANLIEPKIGIDVLLAATWPENTPDTALTVEIEPDGLDTQSQTRWSSSGSLDEAITFTWK